MPTIQVQSTSDSREQTESSESVKKSKGSNAWVVHGNLTESGQALLGSDLHAEHQVPGFFYLASLQYPGGFKVAGATIPGLPLVIVGRNQDLAWGLAASNLELVDLYSVKVDEERKNYFHNDRWKRLESKPQVIHISKAADYQFTTFSTHQGPIITNLQPVAGGYMPR